jgi:hypothetical protein
MVEASHLTSYMQVRPWDGTGYVYKSFLKDYSTEGHIGDRCKTDEKEILFKNVF